jgi:ATP-dependent helicase HepA
LISATRKAIKSETAIRVIRGYTGLLRDMLETSESLANRQAPALLASARELSQQTLGKEMHRLDVLARVNPNVRREETEFLQLQLQALTAALDSATLRLDALRVLIAT